MFRALPFLLLAFFFALTLPAWFGLIAAFGVLGPWLAFGVLAWAIVSAERGPRRGPRWLRYKGQWSDWHDGWQVETPGDFRQPLPSGRPWGVPSQPRREVEPAASGAGPGAEPSVSVRRPELPVDVQVKIEQIRHKAERLANYASRFPAFSQDLYVVRQTTADYLPRTVEAYLALPASARDQVATALGKSALQELKEQLNLLDQKLNEIGSDLQRRYVDHLLANRRFLEDRFGRASF